MKYKNLLIAGMIGISSLAFSLEPVFAKIKNYFTINVDGKQEQKYFVPREEWKILYSPEAGRVENSLAITQRGEEPIKDIIVGIKYKETGKTKYLVKGEEGSETIVGLFEGDIRAILENRATLVFVGSNGKKILGSYNLDMTKGGMERVYWVLNEIEREGLMEIIRGQRSEGKALEMVVGEQEGKIEELEGEVGDLEKKASLYEGLARLGIPLAAASGAIAGIVGTYFYMKSKRKNPQNPGIGEGAGTNKNLNDRIGKEKEYINLYNQFGGIKARAKRFGFGEEEAMDILRKNDLARFSMEIVKNDERRKGVINRVIEDYRNGGLTVKDACEKIKKEGRIKISKSTFYKLRKYKLRKNLGKLG